MSENNQTKFCIHCGQAIPINSMVCPKCGKQVGNLPPKNNSQNQMPQNNMGGKKPKENWYESTGIIILFLIIFFPVGLFLMWKYSKWSKVPKVIISVFWGLIVVANLGNNNNATTSSTKPTTEVKEEVAKEETKEEVKEEKTPEQTEQVKKEEKKEVKKEEKKEEIPTEYKSALAKAQQYSKTMSMSKQGIYDQLVSEHGEKFSAPAAQYAIDNLQADYKQNALKKAQTYQKSMSMSPSAIYDQLISEHGEKFTPEEAQYAIDNLK